jgi:hypothetical protein
MFILFVQTFLGFSGDAPTPIYSGNNRVGRSFYGMFLLQTGSKHMSKQCPVRRSLPLKLTLMPLYVTVLASRLQ